MSRTARPQPLPEALAPRQEALSLVAGVLDEGRLLTGGGAEAARLAGLVLRRLGQIDGVLAGLVPRTPPAPACHILRLMAAELLFAGTPPHAAVDSAVRLARADRRAGRMAGLVNAVGRKLAAGVTVPDPGCNMPAWLRTALTADWGAAVADGIAAAHLIPAPHDLAVKAPADTDALARELNAEPLPGGGLRLLHRPQLTALPGFAEGAWWVQDAAAQIPVRLLGDVAGARVVDLCAAPGGKTLQLAAAGAEVTAVDLSAPRMARLDENLARTGLAARTAVADATAWRPDGPVDAVMLDAPCSATGTIRRHPDLPHRGAPDLAALTALQARLLSAAFAMLRPGGRLVYATCSLLHAEGEAQIAAFLAAEPRARLCPAPAGADPAEFFAPDGSFRSRPDHWPERGGLDGFYAACLERQAD